MEDLEGSTRHQEYDRWTWKLEEVGVFWVKSMHGKLEGLMVREDNRMEDEKRMFRQIWKSRALSTRINLHKRNVIPMESAITCVWCMMEIGSSNHLFLHCSLARNIWLELMWWLDFNFITPPNLFVHWEMGVLGRRVNE